MSVIKENNCNVLVCDGTKCKELNGEVQKIRGDLDDTQVILEDYSKAYGWMKSGSKHYCSMCTPK